jgi:photosystem II stability/assembly factor-like uncharacterized protein
MNRSSRVQFRLGLVVLAPLISTVATAGVGVWTTNGPPGGSYTVITASGSPGIVYAGSTISGLVRSADNGSTWTGTGLPNAVAPLATSPPATIYASTQVPVATTSLQVSHDGGMHWTVIAGGDFNTFGVAVDPVVSTTLFVSSVTTGPGIFEQSSMSRSVDGGASWTEIDSGLGLSTTLISTMAVDPSTSGTVYVVTTPKILSPGATHGIYKSSDAGTTWSFLPASESFFRITTLAIDPRSSSVIYAGSPFSGVGVVKSVDGGSTFSSMNSGLTNPNVGSLCIDPVRPNRLYAATGAGVFVSVDGAMSWQPMNTGLTDLNVYAMAIDSTGRYLHAATLSGVFDYEIAVSACTPDTHTLCLNNGRFSVTADFQSTPAGPSTPATAVPLTSDTGYFWFFDPSNIELVTKVLYGCVVNGSFWFFASGLTNVGVQINVTDTVTGAAKPYANTLGTPFQPIQDTSAFPCP